MSQPDAAPAAEHQQAWAKARRHLAEALNRLYEERVSADYDIAELTSADVAHECPVRARGFPATCASAVGDRLDKSGYR